MLTYNILKIIILITSFTLTTHSSIEKNSINEIKKKYLLTDNNKKKIEFGLKDNLTRRLINTRGQDKYDEKGKIKKIGISNKFLINNETINKTSNKEIEKNNTFENFFQNNETDFSKEDIDAYLDDLLSNLDFED